MKILKDKRAVTAMVIALVVALVAIAIIIPIGLMVTTNIEGAIELEAASEEANITEDVFSNIYTAFGLSALVPIIAVAGLLIAIIIGAFAFRRIRG